MVDPTIVREWLDKADEDLRFAESSLKDGSATGPPIIPKKRRNNLFQPPNQ